MSSAMTTGNAQELAQIIVECASSAKYSDDCGDRSNTKRVVKESLLPFYPTVTLLQAHICSYSIDSKGQRVPRGWASSFVEKATALQSSALLGHYKKEHEQRLATLNIGSNSTEESYRQLQTVRPLPGRYTMYAIVVEYEYWFAPAKMYHVGTICVYSPPERYGEKRISLDISPLQEVISSRNMTFKQARSITEDCISQLHWFADLFDIGRTYRVVVNSKHDHE